METQVWKKCSNCKTAIGFKQLYFACSVSTCNHVRTGLYFCSVSCWSGHLPIMRHREAWALEKTSPAASEISVPVAKAAAAHSGEGTPMTSEDPNQEILVVVSKLKAYIRDKSDMSTSADVLDKLSDKIRGMADEAILRAKQDGRKTVMARDF